MSAVDNSTIESRQVTFLSEKYIAEVNKLPRDSFIDSILTEADYNESMLSSIRLTMCQKARLISGFPNKELIKRRKTRVGNSLESKLASDCHKLCLFIQGGSKDEISDLFVTEKSGTTDIVSSQGREADLICSSQPDCNQMNTDIILNATADILALRNDLNEFKTESEKSAERFSKMIKEMKTNHSRQLENIQKDLNSQMQENNKLRTYHANKIHECKNSISMCQNKLTSQAETISQLEATNVKLTNDLKNCCEFQNCLDAA